MSQRTRNRGVILLLVGVLVVLIVAFGMRTGWRFAGPQVPSAAITVIADAVDAGHEGRLVNVHGRLSADQPPEDPDLGLRAADAIVLVREVEMFQWQQSCSAGSCVLQKTWSPELIDSTNFGESAKPRNPDRFPIASGRFVGQGIRLGAFLPDADLLVSSTGLTPRSVSLAELPANLAASFSVSAGTLISGNDPDHPVIGDLRIRYRIVAGGEVRVTGIQQLSRLVEPAHAQEP